MIMRRMMQLIQYEQPSRMSSRNVISICLEIEYVLEQDDFTEHFVAFMSGCCTISSTAISNCQKTSIYSRRVDYHDNIHYN